MEQGMLSAVHELYPVLLICGPIVGTLLLLNLRERRERALLGALTAQVDPGVLRSSLAIRVRCSLLTPRARVVLGVYRLSHEEVLGILNRLIRILPHSVRLAGDDETGFRDVPVRAGGEGAAGAVLTAR